jgi:hypothetical protein
LCKEKNTGSGRNVKAFWVPVKTVARQSSGLITQKPREARHLGKEDNMKNPDPREHDPRYKKIFARRRWNKKTQRYDYPKKGQFFVMFVKIDSEAK